MRVEDVGGVGSVGILLLLPPLPSLADGLELLAGLDVAVAEVGYRPDPLGRDGIGQDRAGFRKRQPGGQYLGDGGNGDACDVQTGVDGGAGSILCGGSSCCRSQGDGQRPAEEELLLALELALHVGRRGWGFGLGRLSDSRTDSSSTSGRRLGPLRHGLVDLHAGAGASAGT